MTHLKKFDLKGTALEAVEIEDSLLEHAANSQMIKDYIIAIRANKRQWSASTKDKSEVNHTGAKPHPQKGTGRARQGSLASPQYKGGGVVGGPKPKFDQHVKVNKKEKRAAIRHLISAKIKEGKVHLLKAEHLAQPKTQVVVSFLAAAGLEGKKVLFLSEYEHPVEYVTFAKSIRNIPKIRFLNLGSINGYELMSTDHIILMEPAYSQLTELLGRSK